VRNIAVFAVLVIIFFGTLGAQEQAENPFALSLSYQFGFLYGQAEEIVYPSNTKATLLSQLLWEMKPVWYNGLQLDFARINPLHKRSFFASLALKFGISGKSGTMEDRDWQSIENDALTSFSSHDNITRELFMADVMGGIALPFRSGFLLKIHASFSYMLFRFSGMDGYGIYARSMGSGIYASIDDDPRRVDYDGRKVINYSQQWMVLALGFSFNYYFNRFFSAGLSFQISPLVFCNGLDEHFYNSPSWPDVQFNDYLFGGLFLEPGAGLSLSPTQWLTIALDCSWRHISGSRGGSYNRTYGTSTYVQEGEAGGGLSIINTGLRLKVRL
jgi:outer membrane protease